MTSLVIFSTSYINISRTKGRAAPFPQVWLPFFLLPPKSHRECYLYGYVLVYDTTSRHQWRFYDDTDRRGAARIDRPGILVRHRHLERDCSGCGTKMVSTIGR